MSDTHAPHGASNDKRRRNRRRQGSQPNRNRSGSFRPSKAPKQTTFQKILGFLTFGLLGGSKKKKPGAQRREPTSNVTIVSSKPRQDGAGRERGERGGDRARRQPAPADPASVTTERLYVGNLSYDASESDLFELFNGVGDVRNAEVVVNNRTQRSKGFAFVTMGSVDEARRAVSELHGKDFMGRPLQISGAKPASSRDEDREDEDTADNTADEPAAV